MKQEADIYCPLCVWRPRPADRWLCFPGCGTQWNTFWTRALCPGCGHQWMETACLRCGKMSSHESWYHYPNAEDSSIDEAKTRELETS